MSSSILDNVAPNTPVIIGVGFSRVKNDDPLACPEAYQLMVDAVKDAGRDVGVDGLLPQLQAVSVAQGMWKYKNPGKLIMDALGCSEAKSILSDLGVLQLTTLFELFEAIENKEYDLAVLTGGEAKYRDLRSKITGVEITDTEQSDDTPDPDTYHPVPDPFVSDAEAAAGLFMATQLFAVMESALRYDQGLSLDEHRDKLAQLYNGFSKVAANNPHAWNQEEVSVDAIRNATGKNTMLAFPYTKKHNSQWNVNQAVAIIVASAAKAKELGVADSNIIFPVAAVQSRHVVCLAEKKKLYSNPGSVMGGERAYKLAGITANDIDIADLYSCFPIAVQSFERDLQLEGVCPLSVTGCMAFSGGPFNHSALDGVARMVEVLRSGEGVKSESNKRLGLTSNLSGIFGKQAVAIFSNEPSKNGYGFADITDEVAKVDIPIPSVKDYTGSADIIGYTVTYNKDNTIAQGFVYCDTPDGKRTVANSTNATLLQPMVEAEFIGKTVTINEDRSFTF